MVTEKGEIYTESPEEARGPRGGGSDRPEKLLFLQHLVGAEFRIFY